MSKIQRLLFSLALIICVGASVYLSFQAISRPTYEYEYQENIGGMDLEGEVFSGFNGNSTTADVRVYHPMVKNENRVNDDDPAYVEDTTRNVVAIDRFTFVSDEHMQYCYIGPDVQYIDEQAFFGCFALRAIYVDEANPYFTDVDGVLYSKDMKTIYLYPTYHISHLQDTGVVPVGYYDDGAHVETFEIPEGVEKISTGCFYKTWGIQEITLPSTLKEIGTMAFFKCQSLKLINLPDGLEIIREDAFSYCFSMTGALYIPESVKEIGHHAFYECNVEDKSPDGELFFYLAAKSEDDIILGSNWMPKHGNWLKSRDPEFGKTRQDAADFNATYVADYL